MVTGGSATSRNCPAQTREGRTLTETRENLKEAGEMIIEANCELTRLEIGSNATTEELLVAA